jgi:hypothetical protein
MNKILFLILFILFNSYGADWKLIGIVNTNKPEWVFFNKDDIDTLENGNIKIWVKSMRAQAVNSKDSVFIRTSANKIAFGYIPPYALLHNSKHDEILDIAMFETMAELQRGELKSLLLVEMNLKLKQFRMLSVTVYKNGEGIEDNKIGNWEYIKPETNFKTLSDILQLKNHSLPSNE